MRRASSLAMMVAAVACVAGAIHGAPRLAAPARPVRRPTAEDEARLAAAAAKRARRAARHQGRA